MVYKEDIVNQVEDFFSEEYQITGGTTIPKVDDIALGNNGKELELAMLFIDIHESTKIVDEFRRTTAAKMYKSFLWGVAEIARMNNGELRSFNGDGVLIVFIGNNKCTNATKASLQMSWFCQNILKPKIDSYLRAHSTQSDFEFDFGIGIDVGNVLVVRGGIRGDNNNDLVWVGNATNFAVKLSNLSKEGYHMYISNTVYSRMNNSSKYGGESNRNMWEERVWTDMGAVKIYRSIANPKRKGQIQYG